MSQSLVIGGVDVDQLEDAVKLRELVSVDNNNNNNYNYTKLLNSNVQTL